MKYGILFLTLAVLMAGYAFTAGGWWLSLIWPSISFGSIGMGYVWLGHHVFGKRSNGSMSWFSIVVMLPYLLYLWAVWNIYRLISREARFDTLIEDVFIGRRLLSWELPDDIQTVVDLTSEFCEPCAVRSVKNYFAIPMLDASSLDPQAMADLANRLVSVETPLFVHCAQGHGRTGLVAALYLIARGDAANAEEALALVQTARPLVGLNRIQYSSLVAAAEIIRS